MNCEEAREAALDVLYGEAIEGRSGYDFFSHLDLCPDCKKDYLELIKTREVLASWKVEPEAGFATGVTTLKKGTKLAWWPAIQRIAATVLILLGIVWILQSTGLWPNPRVTVSQEELVEMVHDMIVVQQAENWKVVGRALLEAKEELEARNRVGLQVVGEEVKGLEQRFVSALEENNRQVKMLLTSRE